MNAKVIFPPDPERVTLSRDVPFAEVELKVRFGTPGQIGISFSRNTFPLKEILKANEYKFNHNLKEWAKTVKVANDNEIVATIKNEVNQLGQDVYCLNKELVDALQSTTTR